MSSFSIFLKRRSINCTDRPTCIRGISGKQTSDLIIIVGMENGAVCGYECKANENVKMIISTAMQGISQWKLNECLGQRHISNSWMSLTGNGAIHLSGVESLRIQESRILEDVLIFESTDADGVSIRWKYVSSLAIRPSLIRQEKSTECFLYGPCERIEIGELGPILIRLVDNTVSVYRDSYSHPLLSFGADQCPEGVDLSGSISHEHGVSIMLRNRSNDIVIYQTEFTISNESDIAIRKRVEFVAGKLSNDCVTSCLMGQTLCVVNEIFIELHLLKRF